MSELKIGGFKNNNSNPEYELDLTSQEVIVETPVTSPEDIVIETPSEPVITPEPTPEVISSLTPPVETPQVVEITDEKALAYLSEKLNRTITSLDELSKTTPNPLEEDPYVKDFYEWRKKTNGRPIEDYLKSQKDYSKVSDIEVVREFLQLEYPTFTPDEINLELEQFKVSDDDLDEEIRMKQLSLKKYAIKGREKLKEISSTLTEPLKIKYSEEVETDLALAKQVKESFSKQKDEQRVYLENVEKASLGSEIFKLKLSDDFAIDYKIDEQVRKSLPTLINTMPHWQNPDGSWNHQAVVSDAIKISQFDKMIKLAYEQGIESGKELIISNTKNTTLATTTPASAQSNDRKGVEIEGLDDYLGNKGVSLKFKKQ